MIRTARILLAGLLHVIAAKVDARESYIVEVDMDYINHELGRQVAELDAQARMN
jgi:hypothetical protein